MARLPEADDDKILTLRVHYFAIAKLMKRHVDKFDPLTEDVESVSRNYLLDWLRYRRLWLGMLYSVCEHFEHDVLETMPYRNRIRITRSGRDRLFADLMPNLEVVKGLIQLNGSALRTYRNYVFHRHHGDQKQKGLSFVGNEDNLEWAAELHRRLDEFFEGYWMTCLTIYYFENMKSAEILRKFACDSDEELETEDAD